LALQQGERDLIYRNRHEYSDYRLFSVTSDYEISVPEAGQ